MSVRVCKITQIKNQHTFQIPRWNITNRVISLVSLRAFISTWRNSRVWLEEKATKMTWKGSDKPKKYVSEAITVAMSKKKKKKKIYKIEGMDVKLVSKNVTHKPTDEKICSFCFKIMQNSKWFDICLLRRNERRGND